jgi:WD40 repeat protein
MGRSWHAVFSPDGRWLAASTDRRVGVWDLTGNAPGALATEGIGARLFWMPDGRELLGSGDENCFRWRIQPATNPSAPPMLQRLELRPPAGFVSLSLASNSIVWTSSKGSRITEPENLAADDGDWVETAQGISRISPDARWLAIYRAFGTVLHVYRLPGMEPVARLTNQASIAGVNFSPSRDEIAVASRGQVEFWSTTSWERTRAAANFIGIPHVGMLFEPDGRSIWLVKDYQAAGLYQSQTLEPLLFLPNGMLPLAVGPDGRYLAVSVDAQRLQVWDLVALRGQLRELGLDWKNR